MDKEITEKAVIAEECSDSKNESPRDVIPAQENELELGEAYNEILEALPEDKREKLVALVQHSEYFSGPLPPPALLSQYDAILPGCAERIVSLTENEQKNRFKNDECDRETAKSNRILDNRGQIIAAILMSVFGVSGVVLCFLGNLGAAALLLGPTILSVIVSFLPGKKSLSKE